MKTIRKNKKEDLKLLIDLGEKYHGEDVVFTFSAGKYGINRYVCSYVGGVQTNCVVNNSSVLCLLDNHGLSLGMLSVEIDIRVPDTQMPDGNFRHVTRKIASFNLGGEECNLELTNGESDYFPIESVPEAAINLLSTVIKGEPGKDADIAGCNAAIASARELEEAVAKAETEREKAEGERQSSETERKQCEEARLQSESERNKAEQARKLAEEERNEAEASRNTAETQRVEAESQRQKDVEDAIALMESAERKATDATIAAQSATANANNATSSANEATANAVSATQNAQAATEATVIATANANAATTNANAAAENATNAANRTTELSNKAEETIAKSEKAASDAASAVEQANTAVETANSANEAAGQAVTNANIAAENANKAADKANEAADLVYNGPDEVVAVALYSAVEGVSTAGLDLYVYINDNTVPLIYTTDENGMATFRVTKGLRYDIVFPDITGCAPIGRLSYTAALATRGIEVTYREYMVVSTERVTIAFRKYPENTTWNGGEIYADGVAFVTIDGEETMYHADSSGMIVFEVPIGKEYNVRIEKPDGLHLLSGVYSSTYTAEGGSRFIPVSFHLYLSSFLIVDADGGEWTVEGWEAAGKEASEAKLLHVATEELLAVGCDFFMSLDMMAYRKYDTTGATINYMIWAAKNVEFTSIPLNGNSPDKDYYYDGLTATNLIVEEGLNRGIVTDCHTTTLRQTFNLGLEVLKGFTPSYGQWAVMIANYACINSIVTAMRPDGDVVTKFWGILKGTSTQSSATSAWYVSRYLSDTSKAVACFPFCAYAKKSL